MSPQSVKNVDIEAFIPRGEFFGSYNWAGLALDAALGGHVLVKRRPDLSIKMAFLADT